MADACAAMGRPMGSKWCLKSNNNNDDIAADEVGTVVGVLHGQGKVEVKFGQVTECFASDELFSLEAWQKREAVRFHVLSVFFSQCSPHYLTAILVHYFSVASAPESYSHTHCRVFSGEARS